MKLSGLLDGPHKYTDKQITESKIQTPLMGSNTDQNHTKKSPSADQNSSIALLCVVLGRV